MLVPGDARFHGAAARGNEITSTEQLSDIKLCEKPPKSGDSSQIQAPTASTQDSAEPTYEYHTQHVTDDAPRTEHSSGEPTKAPQVVPHTSSEEQLEEQLRRSKRFQRKPGL